MFDYLSLNYVYYEGEVVDSFFGLLTCNEFPLYMILKLKIRNIHMPYNLFVNDTSVFVKYSNNIKFADLLVSPKFEFNDDLFTKKSEYMGNGTEAVKVLEDLLDSGETPVVHTYHPRLPFNNGYISLDDISVKPEESWHFFLMVGHDKENFYYVDSPNFMNMQNYEHHPENRSVGVLKKSTLLKAFEVFAHFIVMEINMKALLDNKRVFKFVDIYMNSFESNYYEHDGFNFCSCRDAFKYLADCCRNGDISLDDYIEEHKKSLCEVIVWKLNFLYANRQIFLGSIQDNNHLSGNKDLHTILQEDIKLLYSMTNEIRNMYGNQEYEFGDEIISYFEKAADIEQALYNSFCDLKSKLPQAFNC